MKLQQILYFIALCEEHHFTRAARRCGVAQPSLTRAIQLLEQELGGALFQRTHDAIELSPLGSAVQPYLCQIARAATAARDAAEKAIAVWPASHSPSDNRANDRMRSSVVRRGGRYRAQPLDRSEQDSHEHA
jgi:DNA-binding transcriptional LysR family regulator